MKVNRLTLNRLIKLSKKHGINILCKQLSLLPFPEYLRIRFTLYRIPKNVVEFSANLVWGQRLFMATPQESDVDSFLYLTSCYFQRLKDKTFDEGKAVDVFNILRRKKLKDLYPITVQISALFIELIANETSKLNRSVDKKMLAAEVDRLNVFSEFQVLEYLAKRYGCKLEEAVNIPYDIALTMLWEKKESDEFQERYNDVIKSSVK